MKKKLPSFIHTHFLAYLRDQHASVYTLHWLASGNADGDADGYHLRFLVPAAGAALEDNYGDRVFADGQWKCVRPAASWFLLHAPVLVL